MAGNIKIDDSVEIEDSIKIDDIAPIGDRSADLEAEIEELQAEVRRLSDRLNEERAHRGVLQRAVGFATARARALERTGPTVGVEDQVGADSEILVEPQPSREVIEVVDVLDGAPVSDDRPARDLPLGDESWADGNLYVFDDEDESREAFDRFFGAPDPHLDKVRGFLLD